jgi:hypothetical protein
VNRSVDVLEGPDVNLCAPPVTTSCMGLLDFGSESECPDDCGDNNLAGDGYCVDEVYCSSFCTENEECPEGVTCSGVPLACRRD